MVNLIGEKIKHKILGIGTVISVEGNHIIIKFPSKTSKFVYPSAFEKFLIPEDKKTADAVNAELMTAIEAEVKKKAEEEAKKVEEEQKSLYLQQEKENKKQIRKSGKVKGKDIIKKTRNDALKYLVFQDKCYDEEFSGQFIHIYGIKKNDRVFYYKEPLFDVMSGDIIFHCVNGYLRAISIVKDQLVNNVYTDCTGKNHINGDEDSLKIDCEYHVLKNPVKYKDDILEIYSKQDKDVNDNKKYLFGLDEKLAEHLLTDAFSKNKFLNSIDVLSVNLYGAPVITSREELFDNCRVLDEYIASRRDPEYSYALDLIKNGICFAAINTNGEYKFYPSRFVGYQGNFRSKHMNNSWKDGKETNPAISAVLGKGKPLPNIELEVLYREYCEKLGFEARDKGSFGKKHKYWNI